MARTRKQSTASTSAVTGGSGNVFADLGLPLADERQAKAELVRQIALLIEQAGWTQVEAARQLDIDQPKVSALLRGQLSGFSTERLLRFLTALGQDVEIVIRRRNPRATRRPRLQVTRRVA